MTIDPQVIQGIPLPELLDTEQRHRLLAAIAAPDNDDWAAEALAEVAERLLAAKELDLAEEVVLLRPLQTQEGVDLRIALAEALRSRGEQARADLLLLGASKALAGIETAWQRAEALLTIGRRQAAWGRREEACSLVERAIEEAKQGQKARSRQDSLDASSVLAEATEMLVELGFVRRAEEVVRDIRAWLHRRRVKMKIASYRRASR